MFGETTIFHVMIWNHPIETTIYKQMFQVPVPGIYIYVCVCHASPASEHVFFLKALNVIKS